MRARLFSCMYTRILPASLHSAHHHDNDSLGLWERRAKGGGGGGAKGGGGGGEADVPGIWAYS